MHWIDFGTQLLREIDELLEGVDARVLGGQMPDFTMYREQIARRIALSDVRDILVERIGRTETR